MDGTDEIIEQIRELRDCLATVVSRLDRLERQQDRSHVRETESEVILDYSCGSKHVKVVVPKEF